MNEYKLKKNQNNVINSLRGRLHAKIGIVMRNWQNKQGELVNHKTRG